MKKALLSVCACLLAVSIACGIGGYSAALAKQRKVPIYKVATSERKVAISFDAAWGADKTRQIMDVCEEYGVCATFFLVGFWVDKFPDLAREIHERGHEIGTHSATHPKMSTLPAEKVREELTTSCEKIFNATGTFPELFRPPFGDYDDQLLTAAEDLGLYTIQWSLDSLDWKGLSARSIAERVSEMESGDIILCHNNSDHIVEALPAIFAAAKLKNLTFVPIGQLIYKENYRVDSNGTQSPQQ